ncbi:DUF3140 domain-containing protein [Bailinhaonella thermotolerans]|uniref:DUF3140 domain-containing protein n=1 Tax=Bailinhaonella thermotolerans TaxID=1070861 RepID=A0A3A4ADM7_9ACTN|nr:DUF3140 domain-containing protein [Bailinhaonella thermotolerans]RJL24150.1 DUF3140 domain-containing protein [Bailinhaonella thermotolerans]
MTTTRGNPEVEELWREFHGLVNMTSQELQGWLMTASSGEDGFTADPDLGMPELSRHVVRLLGKRKVDLTREDVECMGEVVSRIREELERPGGGDPSDDVSRHRLMSLGHDPLKPEGGVI